MILTNNRGEKRRGLTLVETAFVMIPLTMLFFGIFVYGQLLMDWNLLINAAEEGCRFALANNTDTTLTTDVQNVVTSYLAGTSNSLGSVTVTVSGTHQGSTYQGNQVNNLSPGDPITVTVTTTYQFPKVIPLVSMPSSMPLSSSATLICEGGT